MKFKEKKSFKNIPQAEGMNIVAPPPFPPPPPLTLSERAPRLELFQIQRTKLQTYGNAIVTKKALAFTNIYKARHNLSPAHQQKCRKPVH